MVMFFSYWHVVGIAKPRRGHGSQTLDLGMSDVGATLSLEHGDYNPPPGQRIVLSLQELPPQALA